MYPPPVHPPTIPRCLQLSLPSLHTSFCLSTPCSPSHYPSLSPTIPSLTAYFFLFIHPLLTLPLSLSVSNYPFPHCILLSIYPPPVHPPTIPLCLQLSLPSLHTSFCLSTPCSPSHYPSLSTTIPSLTAYFFLFIHPLFILPLSLSVFNYPFPHCILLSIYPLPVHPPTIPLCLQLSLPSLHTSFCLSTLCSSSHYPSLSPTIPSLTAYFFLFIHPLFTLPLSLFVSNHPFRHCILLSVYPPPVHPPTIPLCLQPSLPTLHTSFYLSTPCSSSHYPSLSPTIPSVTAYFFLCIHPLFTLPLSLFVSNHPFPHCILLSIYPLPVHPPAIALCLQLSLPSLHTSFCLSTPCSPSHYPSLSPTIPSLTAYFFLFIHPLFILPLSLSVTNYPFPHCILLSVYPPPVHPPTIPLCLQLSLPSLHTSLYLSTPCTSSHYPSLSPTIPSLTAYFFLFIHPPVHPPAIPLCLQLSLPSLHTSFCSSTLCSSSHYPSLSPTIPSLTAYFFLFIHPLFILPLSLSVSNYPFPHCILPSVYPLPVHPPTIPLCLQLSLPSLHTSLYLSTPCSSSHYPSLSPTIPSLTAYFFIFIHPLFNLPLSLSVSNYPFPHCILLSIYPPPVHPPTIPLCLQLSLPSLHTSFYLSTPCSSSHYPSVSNYPFPHCILLSVYPPPVHPPTIPLCLQLSLPSLHTSFCLSTPCSSSHYPSLSSTIPSLTAYFFLVIHPLFILPLSLSVFNYPFPHCILLSIYPTIPSLIHLFYFPRNTSFAVNSQINK